MEELPKEANKYFEEDDKGNSTILEKIDEICEQYRNENTNKKIADLDEWNISDFFGINDLERIKQTPEYIVEKILIKFKNFINFNEYFFIIKPKEISDRDLEKSRNEKKSKIIKKRENNNKRKNKNGERLGEENTVDEINDNTEMESIEEKSGTKQKGEKNESKKDEKENEEDDKKKFLKEEENKNKKEEKKTEKNSKEEKKKTKKTKKHKAKSQSEKRSNSTNSIQRLSSYNLSIYSEGENEKIYNLKIKRSNSLFDKEIIYNNFKNIKNFLDSSDGSKSKNLMHKQKYFNKKKKDDPRNNKYKSQSNSSNLLFKNNNSSISKNSININSNDISPNIKNSSSSTKKKLENNFSNIPSKSNSSSIFFNFKYSESSTNINENKNKEKNEKKENMDTYKLRFFKEKLNLEEGENLSGKAYEEYARKVIKLMFIISLKIIPNFFNPQNIVTEYIINFYKTLLESGIIKQIDTPICSSIFEETKKEKNLEIDIVFELKKNEIIKFVKKYSKIIFFQSYFLNENEIDINEKATCYMEIARNLISQGKEKLGQIKKYIKIIIIMNNMRQFLSNIKNYEEILIPYKTSESTEKIFSIITDGNYEELKFVINEIVIPKLNTGVELNYTEIKKDIEIKLSEKNSSLFEKVENKDSLIDNIYYVLEMFYYLKINKIKFCLIYIGDICESKCELSNFLKGVKLLNDCVIKGSDKLVELKNIYKEIKNF